MDATKYARGFLTSDDVKDGDIIIFRNEGKETKFQSGDVGLTINVSLDGIEMPYTPFGDVVKALIIAWGKDTKNWIGKSAEVTLRKYVDGQNQDKKAIVLAPLGEGGTDVEEKDIPVVEIEEGKGASDGKRSKDGVNVGNIPF